MADWRRRKRNRKQMLFLGIFELVLMFILGIASYFISLSEKIGYVPLSNDIYVAAYYSPDQNYDKQNQNHIETKIDTPGSISMESSEYGEKIKGFRNYLVVGVDSRDQSTMTQGANADVILVVSLNEKNGEIRMVSILRDTLFHIIDGGKYHSDRKYDKVNAQCCYTNISDMVSMINLNLDLNIKDYVVVNWGAAARMIDTLGGIEVTIENEEILSYLNGYLTEVNAETGIFSPQIQAIGTQNLCGTQAVAFSRIRFAGLEDIGRTANQREMVIKMLDKLKLVILERPSVAAEVCLQAAENIVTNLTLKEIGGIAFRAGKMNISGHSAFPFHFNYGSEQTENLTGGVKDCLLPDNMEQNVIMLHQYLFGEAANDYKPSEEVKRISRELNLLSGL